MAAEQSSGARVDTWIWAVRLAKSRSAAQTAVKGGHVKVNGTRVKPAHTVRPGDEIRVLQGDRERIVEVAKIITKRVGAAVAVECYADHSPPPPPKTFVPPVPTRERGAGRPTKRDRRALDRLMGKGRELRSLVADTWLSYSRGHEILTGGEERRDLRG